jgi:hypothetical protein
VPSSAVESMTFGGLSGLTALANETGRENGGTKGGGTAGPPTATGGNAAPKLPGV